MDNKLNKEEFNEALVDVRNAYRLIFAYQERLFAAIHKLAAGYKCIYGSPKFYNQPSLKSNFKIDRSSWRYLPIYFFHFKYEIIGDDRLSIYVITDTGYFENNKGESKNDLNNFKEAENSSSYFYMVFHNYNTLSYKEKDTFVTKLNKEKHYKKDGVNSYYAKKFKLDNLLDEKHIQEVRKDFNDELKSHINRTIF